MSSIGQSALRARAGVQAQALSPALASLPAGFDLRFLAFGAAGLAVAGWLAHQAGGLRLALALALAGAIGFALRHASFGFSHGYRSLITEGRGAHVRAQILLIGLAVALFHPALHLGTVLGAPVRGFVFPIGVELVIGAVLFGVGMQLANACGSGMLYAAGAGSVRMLVALPAAIGGATVATLTHEHWSGMPRLPAVSIPGSLGLLPGLALQLGVLGGLWLLVAGIERRRHGAVETIFSRPGQSPLQGNWPYAWAAVALALLSFATLVVLGRPWGITQALAVWGSWGVERAGFDDPHFWSFWEEPTRVEALSRAFFADATSVMNLGVVLGAVFATGLAGRAVLRWRLPVGQYASAALGGLLLGFGAILATGCNISALVSGVASGSLHGWVWLAAALAGNVLGVALRPLFGLSR